MIVRPLNGGSRTNRSLIVRSLLLRSSKTTSWLFVVMIGLSFLINAFASVKSAAESVEAWSPHHLDKLASLPIIGGTEVLLSDQVHRSLVRLRISKKRKKRYSFCSGVIVSENLIMTAGHCLNADGLVVEIHFGLIAEGDGHFKQRSLDYRSIHAGKTGKGGKVFDKNGKMILNKNSRKRFLQGVVNKKALRNFSEESPEFGRTLDDLGLIKVSHIPKTALPLPLFSDSARPVFLQSVFPFGYGYNSRIKDENVARLRFSEHQLIGHFTKSEMRTKGLQYFSREQPTCYGDSGGPVLINEDNSYKVLAIHVLGENNCANSSWGVMPSFHRDWILEMTEAMGVHL